MENERKENIMNFFSSEDGTVRTGGFERNEAIPLFTSGLVNIDDHQYNPYDPGSFVHQEKDILGILKANSKVLVAALEECGLFQDPIDKAFIERKDHMGTQISSPWIYEKNSDRFTHNGVHCHIHRNPNYGFLGGYVKVPRRLYKKLARKYAHCGLNFLDVHGGATFIGSWKYGEKGRKVKDGFYVGFDCGHYPDYVPYGISARFVSSRKYRTWEYVEQQTRQLADQVARLINAQK